MRRTILLGVLLAVLVWSGTSWAMDFDDLFGGDLLIELDPEETVVAPEEALLVQDRVEVGGRYNFSLNASRTIAEGADPSNDFRASLGGQLYLDARPDPNFRAFGKVGINYNVNNKEKPLTAELQELFADFNYGNKVFFRAGKQNVKWGVGYFFSPADIINIGRIDPLNPEAEREGPVALKMHYPRGTNNFYLYTLFDGVTDVQQIAFAPKVEFVAGKTEYSLGGFYQKDDHPRVMATVSSSFGDIGFFGEAVAAWGSDRGFLEPKGPAYEIAEKKGLFLQVTAGGMYRWKDSEGLLDLSGTLQYYFNGEGYKDQEGIKAVRLALLNQGFPPVVNPLKLDSLALLGSGRHYLAGALSWNKMFGSKFSASVFLQANLSDGSAMIHSTLRLPSVSKISPSIGVSTNFGSPGTEFGALGRTVMVFAAITIGDSF